MVGIRPVFPGGGHVRAAEGRIHSPCTTLSFADKH
jgi:hypothetical protein